jgi:hypothetical protein
MRNVLENKQMKIEARQETPEAWKRDIPNKWCHDHQPKNISVCTASMPWKALCEVPGCKVQAVWERQSGN